MASNKIENILSFKYMYYGIFMFRWSVLTVMGASGGVAAVGGRRARRRYAGLLRTHRLDRRRRRPHWFSAGCGRRILIARLLHHVTTRHFHTLWQLDGGIQINGRNKMPSIQIKLIYSLVKKHWNYNLYRFLSSEM